MSPKTQVCRGAAPAVGAVRHPPIPLGSGSGWVRRARSVSNSYSSNINLVLPALTLNIF